MTENKIEDKMQELIVRPMTIDDVKDVAGIESRCFADPWTERAFASAVMDDNYLYIVAELDGQLIGMAGIIKSFDEGDVTNVATLPEYRGNGVAGKVLSELMKKASLQGVKNLTLEVREHNTSAIKLYESLGFVCEGKRPGFYDNPKEDALIYWRR